MLNRETALRLDLPVFGIASQPELAWTLTSVEHIQNALPKNQTATFFLGGRLSVKRMATEIASHYSNEYAGWVPHEAMENLSEQEGVSVLFWEGEDIALGAMITTSMEFENNSALGAKAGEFIQISINGNSLTSMLSAFQATKKLTEQMSQFLAELDFAPTHFSASGSPKMRS